MKFELHLQMMGLDVKFLKTAKHLLAICDDVEKKWMKLILYLDDTVALI